MRKILTALAIAALGLAFTASPASATDPAVEVTVVCANPNTPEAASVGVVTVVANSVAYGTTGGNTYGPFVEQLPALSAGGRHELKNRLAVGTYKLGVQMIFNEIGARATVFDITVAQLGDCEIPDEAATTTTVAVTTTVPPTISEGGPTTVAPTTVATTVSPESATTAPTVTGRPTSETTRPYEGFCPPGYTETIVTYDNRQPTDIPLIGSGDFIRCTLQSLPRTGAGPMVMILIASGLVFAGALVLLGRRRYPSAP